MSTWRAFCGAEKWMTPRGSRPLTSTEARSAHSRNSVERLSPCLSTIKPSRVSNFSTGGPELLHHMSKPFPVLPGFYNLLFLHLEPVSTILPAFLIWFWPGWSWFHGELYPGSLPPAPGSDTAEDLRTKMAIWQLGSCEGTLCLTLV